jgi:LysR family carnitine catabolism transcriptional activator
VRQGRAELGICFNPGESEDLIFKELFSDELIAVVPQKHPLARKASTTWEALVDDTLIMLQKPSSMRLYIEEVLNEHQLQISPAIEVNQLATVGKLVALGLGVSTVPKMCEQQMIESGAMCVPLDTPKIERSVGVIWRTRFALSAAAKALHKQL